MAYSGNERRVSTGMRQLMEPVLRPLVELREEIGSIPEGRLLERNVEALRRQLRGMLIADNEGKEEHLALFNLEIDQTRRNLELVAIIVEEPAKSKAVQIQGLLNEELKEAVRREVGR